MPTNRVDCSMTRLLCLRLHARPSGAILDHRHIAMTGHPFRPDTDMRSSICTATSASHSAVKPAQGLPYASVLPTSPDTLLRSVTAPVSGGTPPRTPRVLGVDDWAKLA